MSLAALLPPVAEVAVRLTDQAPDPEDVTAGWLAFAVFVLLIAAVVVLGVSLAKHLRRAEAAKKAGVYGDEPTPEGSIDDNAPHNHSTS